MLQPSFCLGGRRGGRVIHILLPTYSTSEGIILSIIQSCCLTRNTVYYSYYLVFADYFTTVLQDRFLQEAEFMLPTCPGPHKLVAEVGTYPRTHRSKTIQRTAPTMNSCTSLPMLLLNQSCLTKGEGNATTPLSQKDYQHWCSSLSP